MNVHEVIAALSPILDKLDPEYAQTMRGWIMNEIQTHALVEHAATDSSQWHVGQQCPYLKEYASESIIFGMIYDDESDELLIYSAAMVVLEETKQEGVQFYRTRVHNKKSNVDCTWGVMSHEALMDELADLASDPPEDPEGVAKTNGKGRRHPSPAAQ